MIAPPFTAHVEIVTGCNFKCTFCPVYVRPDLQTVSEVMSIETATNLADGLRALNPKLRVEIAMRGEPTLADNLLELLATFRERIPACQMALYTNGSMFWKRPVLGVEMLDAGLNYLCIDCYDNSYERFKKLMTPVVDSTVELLDFDDCVPHRLRAGGSKFRKILLVPDIVEQGVAIRQLHGRAMNSDRDEIERLTGKKLPAPEDFPLKKKCVRPFREITVHANGDIALCCQDWSAEKIHGNVNDTSVYAIWHSEDRREALRRLYHGDRSAAPCSHCDYFGGYRHGFIEDPDAALSFTQGKPKRVGVTS